MSFAIMSRLIIASLLGAATWQSFGAEPPCCVSGEFGGQTESLEGRILEINESGPTCGGQRPWCGALTLTVDPKVGPSNVVVRLGPSWFLHDRGMQFALGDDVTVTGWYERDHDAMVARVVRRDTKSLTLRDERGVPSWRGGHRFTH